MLPLVLRASLTILVFSAVAGGAQTSPRPTPSLPASPIDALDADGLEKAIATIQQHYLNPEAVKGAELKRATLDGLLTRLDRGVVLLPPRPEATPVAAPFYREIIGGHIGYLRPGDLSRSQLQELDTTLRAFAGKKADAIVLDLRGSAETSDFGGAAEFASRFVADNKPLFSVRAPGANAAREFSSKQGTLYSGLIVVLIDGETAGATEALAAVLRHDNKTIIIGQKSAGRALEYSDFPLPGGSVVRVAVAEAALPEGGRLSAGLEPDLAVAFSPGEKRQIFQESLTKGMAQFVFEADRPHLNEAALLSGTNPEIEAAQAAQQRRARGEERSMPHDPVLQRAIDLVTSIGVYEKQPARSP